jgi:hypothetical protein
LTFRTYRQGSSYEVRLRLTTPFAPKRGALGLCRSVLGNVEPVHPGSCADVWCIISTLCIRPALRPCLSSLDLAPRRQGCDAPHGRWGSGFEKSTGLLYPLFETSPMGLPVLEA